MISIADNPAVLQQMAAASKTTDPPDLVSEDPARDSGAAGAIAAYPSMKLELVDGRYRVEGVEN
jgi:hypothetical protein